MYCIEPFSLEPKILDTGWLIKKCVDIIIISILDRFQKGMIDGVSGMSGKHPYQKGSLIFKTAIDAQITAVYIVTVDTDSL